MDCLSPKLSKNSPIKRSSSNSSKLSQNSRPQIKLPSGNFSLFKKGSELSLRPSSPHRYAISCYASNQNNAEETKHNRSSTVSPRSFKFIAATELSPFENIQTPYKPSFDHFEISDEFLLNLSFEDEPKHANVYISPQSNRNSLIASTAEPIQSSLPTTPQDEGFSTIFTVSSFTSYKNTVSAIDLPDKTSEEKPNIEKSEQKSNFKMVLGKIYCEFCENNVETYTQVKIPEKTL